MPQFTTILMTTLMRDLKRTMLMMKMIMMMKVTTLHLLKVSITIV
uniref:Uncharacterized protein n=1 Tax=Arundo donax TaxID=35708 RepID=A0A0A9CMY1_ARUDO